MKAQTYALTGKAFTGKGQAKQVFDILSEGPQTVKAVADRLDKDPNFKTRQTALRIAAYYVCVFKKDGTVEPIGVEETNAFAGQIPAEE